MIAFHGDSSNVGTCQDPSSSLAKGLVPRLLSTLFTGKTSAYAASFANPTHKLRQNNVSYPLCYNSSTQVAGAKLCQDLGIFTGVVDSWSAKNSYSGNLCHACVGVCV